MLWRVSIVPRRFDPTVDPLVRIEAARLRKKLREYYGTDGQGDAIHIDLPKGTYTPQIEFRHNGALIAHRQAAGSRQLAVLVSVALVVGSGAWFGLQWFKPPPTQEVSSTIPSVAVLPFNDLSAARNLGYFGDGVAEDIITALSRFPDLAVVARSSSFAYKGKAVDMRQVGKELGVGYVVEGSVRKDGDKDSESYPSSSTRRMASMSGPSVLTGRARTHRHSRTRSPRRS